MPRRIRELSSTGIYHVMLRGNERKNIFGTIDEKRFFYKTLLLKQKELGFLLFAFCIMDNHVHIALNTNSNEISEIVKGMAVRYASFYNKKYQRVGHVFQDRFKSEVVEDDRYLLGLIRYIHNNPVKAGISRTPQDHYWSSYRCYIQPETPESEMVNTTFILEIINSDRKKAIKDFERFSNETDETRFLDDENPNPIKTLDGGRAYLYDYLNKEWDGFRWEDLKKDPRSRKEIIGHMRSQTQLTVRTISELLGVNKNSVR